MKIWFDTEFYENGAYIKLISIGMTREDGNKYYAETYDAISLCGNSKWLTDNVKPHLKGGTYRRYREDIKEDIIEFAGANPEFWAYYSSYDWVVLCQLFGTMMDLPKGWPMYCRDVQQEADRLRANIPKQDPRQQHNALADAIWTKDAWDYLQMRSRVLSI